MVEFALVLPILMLLTIAAINFGIVVKDWISITNAARIAGRAAAVSRFETGPGCSGVRAAVDAVMTQQDLQPSDASVSPTDPNCAAGSRVTVTITRPWTVNVPFLPISRSGTIESDVTEQIQ